MLNLTYVTVHYPHPTEGTTGRTGYSPTDHYVYHSLLNNNHPSSTDTGPNSGGDSFISVIIMIIVALVYIYIKTGK